MRSLKWEFVWNQQFPLFFLRLKDQRGGAETQRREGKIKQIFILASPRLRASALFFYERFSEGVFVND